MNNSNPNFSKPPLVQKSAVINEQESLNGRAQGGGVGLPFASPHKDKATVKAKIMQDYTSE